MSDQTTRASQGGHLRRLAQFTGRGHEPGRPVPTLALWFAIGDPISRSVLVPAGVRARLLRAFGAQIGENVNIRHDVHIHFPWKLTVGDNSWVGVGTHLLNVEPITIGEDVCISQQSYLCTGSHRADDPAFEYDNAPIVVEDGAWLALRSTVLRGVTIGRDAVVGACALVGKDVPAGSRVLAPRSTSREESL